MSSDLVLVREGQGSVWFYIGRGFWSTSIWEAKRYPSWEAADKVIRQKGWTNVKYIGFEEWFEQKAGA